jgi:hypothetical protein
MTGIEQIAAERDRQVQGEGYDVAHDDTHEHGELAHAALAYLVGNSLPWPWELETFKPAPTNPIRNLAKAGALIAAEIDRLERKGTTK